MTRYQIRHRNHKKYGLCTKCGRYREPVQRLKTRCLRCARKDAARSRRRAAQWTPEERAAVSAYRRAYEARRPQRGLTAP